MRFTIQTFPDRLHAAPDTGRGGHTRPVAEIVTFRLAAGADVTEFMSAAHRMTPFLKESGAALTRTLSVDPDGQWTDHITWKDMASAKSAAAAVMQAPEAVPFMQMIDPMTVTMRHEDINLSLTLE